MLIDRPSRVSRRLPVLKRATYWKSRVAFHLHTKYAVPKLLNAWAALILCFDI